MPGIPTDQRTEAQDIGGIPLGTMVPATAGTEAGTAAVINRQVRRHLARLRRTTRRPSFKRSIDPKRSSTRCVDELSIGMESVGAYAPARWRSVR